MAWNDAPPTKDELSALAPAQQMPAASSSWDSAPPTAKELGGTAVSAADPNQSMATAASAGFFDAVPFAKQIGALGKTGMDAITGTRGPLAGESVSDLVNDYREARDQTTSDFKQAQDAHPVAAFLGSLPSAGIVGGVIPGADSIEKAAVYGGALGLSNSKADLTKGEVGQALDDTMYGAATGGVIGGALEGAGNAISSGAQAIKTGSKRLMSSMLGPSVENIDAYIANSDAVNSARGIHDVKDEVDQFVGKLREQVDNSSMTVDQAKQALKDYQANLLDQLRDNRDLSKSAVQDLKQTLSDQVKEAKFQARDTLYNAKDALDTSYRGTVENLKNSSVTGLKDDILDSIDTLKDKVVKGSNEAYKILDHQKGAIPTDSLVKTLDDGISGLVVQGQAVSDSAAKSFAVLNNLKQRIEAIGEDLSFPEAKQVIQQLDNDLRISMSSDKGSFAPEADAVKSQVRGVLDSMLKNSVPAYRDKMKDVAYHTSLLEDMSAGFGNEGKVLNRLNNIGSEKGREIDTRLLKRLGDSTGKDFLSPINKHLDVLDTLSSPSKLDALKQGLPEYKPFAEAQDAFSQYADPQNQFGMRELIERSPESQAYNQAEANLNNFDQTVASSPETQALAKAQQAQIDAETQFEPYKRLTPDTTEAKLKAVTQDRNNIELKRTFDRIKEETGKDYVQELENLRVKEDFQKSSTNSSRKTVMGATLGSVAGGALGLLAHSPAAGATMGSAIGAMAGGMADKEGGVWAKNILDFYIAHNPSALGEYAEPLINAAKRGQTALAATHYILQQTNPDYRQKIKGLEDKANGNQ